MGVLNSSVSFYRKTVKRIRPAHVAIHRIITNTVIPLLERVKGLKTMPDDPLWFRLELLTNRHETETLSQMNTLVKPGMNVLDIGAHVGYYARRCSDLVGAKGRVIAVEPHPRTFSTLSRNIDGRANVLAVQIAASEEEGTAELYDYLMMSASGSLHYDESLKDLQKSQLGDSDIAPRISSDFPVEKFTVRTRPLDDVLEENGIESVDVIKMDIEGAELGALRGLRRTIGKSNRLNLIMEYNPQALKAFGHDPVEAFQEVLALGFTDAHIINADGTLTGITHQTQHLIDLTATLMMNMGVVNMRFSKG